MMNTSDAPEVETHNSISPAFAYSQTEADVLLSKEPLYDFNI